jgi:YVTN family beta-propeller protein
MKFRTRAAVNFGRLYLSSLLGVALLGFAGAASAQIQPGNWGQVTAPVYGSSEATIPGGLYSDAELFAGPNKFGSYFAGVLPNGRKVTPAGVTIQIGMNPLGAALTPDGNFLVTTNDDEREGGFPSYQNPGVNIGGYSLSVISAQTMAVVSQINTAGKFFIGLQVSGPQGGPYTVWASGGGDNDVKLFNVSSAGAISVGTPSDIKIFPITPRTLGYVTDYIPDAAFNTPDGSGNKPPVPSQFSRTSNPNITFPAGSALSPDGHYLYVACNGDNSLAVIDTRTLAVAAHVSVGYFPYGVSVSADGTKIFVSNWGIEEYKFFAPGYDNAANLATLGTTGQNTPAGFFLPVTSTTGYNPRTSSITVLNAPNGDVTKLTLVTSKYQGHALSDTGFVGDTHPSATALVTQGTNQFLFVTKSNSDTLGVLNLNSNYAKLPDVQLKAITVGSKLLHGAYPNAMVASPDNKTLYVAEAGLNSVAVVDISSAPSGTVVGRIPTDWYPTGLALSSDGRWLYVTNAKGIGEDINPNIQMNSGQVPPPSGLTSDPTTDSNYIFGSLQQIDLQNYTLDNTTVLANNYGFTTFVDNSVVPAGGAASKRIKHVIFILHENKTFDSMLGNQSKYGNYAGTTFNNHDGSTYTNGQFTGVSLNMQALATTFATAVNYYSDSEESDAGHQFAASGTASDYTEKTLLVKTGRGLLVNKNFEPEDYPESGYIFNNLARKNVSFKDYGALVRVQGTDTGTSTPTTLNDPPSGNVGYPQLQGDHFSITNPLVNLGDTTSPTTGLGQSYFMAMPILSILGKSNASGEPHLDANYPGYNFNISDQRRAQEFIADFDRMVQAGTLPTFLYIYEPNDHTGGVQAPNAGSVLDSATAVQQVADGDVGLGMVVNHLLNSSIYYDPSTNTGAAIFITFDDAQSSLDHIHPHRTPLLLVSPFAKPGYLAKRHYVTASVVKTEELLLGLQPNNLGDLLATDLRDMFQSTYNHITSVNNLNLSVTYKASEEGKRIWQLVKQLDTSAPDRDSRRLGVLIRLSQQADDLHVAAEKSKTLESPAYRKQQQELYDAALKLVNTGAPRDSDD